MQENRIKANAQDRSLQIYYTLAYPQAVARQQPDIASDSPRTVGRNQEKRCKEMSRPYSLHAIM